MNATYREEQVAYRQPWLLWPMLLVIAILLYGVYRQIGLKIPLGNNPVPDAVLVVIALLFIGFSFALLRIRLRYEIGSFGVKLTYWPFITREHLIPSGDIQQIEVVKYKPISEYGGWGYRYSLKNKGKAYTISGRYGIRVLLKNGTHVLLGTSEPDAAGAYLSKLDLR